MKKSQMLFVQVYRVYEERKTLEEQFLELTGGKDIV